ncbi:MAG: UbiA family prenyltransferase [Acidimicrobiales bacterium]
MGSVRDYLQLFRAQTAAVEGAGFPLAAWIGGAPLWTLPLFALVGILAHFGGFGENGITDLAYDRLDPSKAEHPLVTGRMTFRRAIGLVYGCQAAGVVLFAAIMVATGHPYAAVPVFAFVGYIFLGHAYNFTGKWWKPGAVLEISGAFCLAFLAMATAWTGRADAVVWAVAVYAFLFTAFQIAIAGELKELARPNEENLLRRLGSRVESPVPAMDELLSVAKRYGAIVNVGHRALTGDWLFTSSRAWVLANVLSAAKAVALGAVAWMLGGPSWGMVVGIAAWAIFSVYSFALLRSGPWNRPCRVKTMGIGEATSYLLLVFALASSLWPYLLVTFLVLPVVWFVSMNRALWVGSGSAWAPGV